MLLNSLRRLARQNPAVVSPVEQGIELGSTEPAEGPAEVEARMIEGDRLQALPVSAVPSRFTAFLNAIQRAEVKAYYGAVPLVYGYAAAAVRARADRTMRAHPRDLLVEREAIFVPFRHLHPAELATAGLTLADLVDTSPPAPEPLPLFPPVLYARAAESLGRWREGIEREVAERWCRQASPDEWLLANGTITVSAELARSARAVGVIRNHRTRFFDGDEARLLLSLKAQHRTSVFAPQSRSWSPVHSWYLRLREPAGRDVFWGLVRVEVAAGDQPEQLANLVSGWLLSETTPLAAPSARWDRLLYPLHDCEQYLRARAPASRLA